MSPNWTNDDGSCAPCHDEARGGSPCFIHGAKPPTKRRRAAKSASPSLDELDALHAAAFPGVWRTGTRGECATVYVTSVPPMRAVVTFAEVSNDDNAHAMAALHNNWPAFSARLRAAEAALVRIRDDYGCDGVGTGGLECRHCIATRAIAFRAAARAE